MPRLFIAVFLGVVILSPGVYATESVGSTEDEVGRIHFDAGRRFYEQGAYRQANTEFTAGYDLTKRPAFLLNMAQCERLLGNRDKAREHYQAYLQRVPASSQAAKIRGLIAQLEAEIAKASHAPPAISDENRGSRTTPESVVATRTQSDRSKRTPVYKKWWLWTTVGLVVAAGVGVGLGVGLTQGGSSFRATQDPFQVPAP